MHDDRAAEGIEHLQAAALQLIEAARAFLDVAEDVVSDREKVSEVVAAFGTIADAATQATRDARRKHQASSGERPERPAVSRDDGVQHIRVS